jgi:hypothetical protein
LEAVNHVLVLVQSQPSDGTESKSKDTPAEMDVDHKLQGDGTALLTSGGDQEQCLAVYGDQQEVVFEAFYFERI